MESVCDPGARACLHEDEYDPQACADGGHDGAFTSAGLATNAGKASAGGHRSCHASGAAEEEGRAVGGGAGMGVAGAYAHWVEADRATGDGPTHSFRDIQAYTFTSGGAPHVRAELRWTADGGTCETEVVTELGEDRAATPASCPAGAPPDAPRVPWGDLVP